MSTGDAEDKEEAEDCIAVEDIGATLEVAHIFFLSYKVPLNYLYIYVLKGLHSNDPLLYVQSGMSDSQGSLKHRSNEYEILVFMVKLDHF